MKSATGGYFPPTGCATYTQRIPLYIINISPPIQNIKLHNKYEKGDMIGRWGKRVKLHKVLQEKRWNKVTDRKLGHRFMIQSFHSRTRSRHSHKNANL